MNSEEKEENKEQDKEEFINAKEKLYNQIPISVKTLDRIIFILVFLLIIVLIIGISRGNLFYGR